MPLTAAMAAPPRAEPSGGSSTRAPPTKPDSYVTAARLTRWPRWPCPILGAGAKSFGLVDVLRLRPETARAKHAGVELALRSFAILATDRWAAALARAPPGEYTLAEIERGLVPARRLTARFYGSRRVIPAVDRFVPFAPFNRVGERTMPGPCNRILLRKALLCFDLPPESKRILERNHPRPRPECCVCWARWNRHWP